MNLKQKHFEDLVITITGLQLLWNY